MLQSASRSFTYSLDTPKFSSPPEFLTKRLCFNFGLTSRISSPVPSKIILNFHSFDSAYPSRDTCDTFYLSSTPITSPTTTTGRGPGFNSQLGPQSTKQRKEPRGWNTRLSCAGTRARGHPALPRSPRYNPLRPRPAASCAF